MSRKSLADHVDMLINGASREITDLSLPTEQVLLVRCKNDISRSSIDHFHLSMFISRFRWTASDALF